MSLEVWQAADYLGALPGPSRTRPIFIECERTQDGGKIESRPFLVKSLGHPEVSAGSLYAEALGLGLAREFGVATPAPALIELGADFVNGAQPFVPSGVQLRVGMGVGVEQLTGFKPLPRDWKMTPALCAPALMIYALDLLIDNADRRIENPNCAFHGATLMAYDFELAFGFLVPLIGRNPQPYQVSQLGIAHRHVFQQPLLANARDWQPFAARLQSLNAPRLQQLVWNLPPAWLVSHPKVEAHILSAQANCPKLLVELETSLRATK